MSDVTNDDSESSDDALGKLMGYDKWPEDVAAAFERARGDAHVRYARNKTLDFASVLADFRAIEAEFVAHFHDNEENARQVRRIMTEMRLHAAWYKAQPFETCQRYWNDLLLLGFYRIERQCLETGSFAVCCHDYGHTDIALALLDPLIGELQRLRAGPCVTTQAAEYYDNELTSLQRLRARLEAERA